MKKILFTFFLAIFIILGITSLTKMNAPKFLYKGLPVEFVNASYAFDISTPEKAVGVGDYMFVAKINKIVRTEYLNPVNVEASKYESITTYDTYTVYDVTVIKNIKGELIENDHIEVMQYGGINKTAEKYNFLEGSAYLSEGDYYILIPGTFGNEKTLEVSLPELIIYLPNFNLKSIKDNVLVNKYINAYNNQYIPKNELTGKNIERNISKYDAQFNK